MMERAISKSLEQVENLNHLIHELLDVSRIRAGRLSLNVERVNLSEVLELVVEQHQLSLRDAACRVQADIEREVFAYCDRSRMQQVFNNLLANTVKYAPGCEMKVTLKVDQSAAQLSFADNGPGIPAEKQGLIFERFERATSSTHVSGLGLGLFIVKRIVEAHGGTIRVESKPGEGTSFLIGLPLYPLESQISGRRENAAEARGLEAKH